MRGVLFSSRGSFYVLKHASAIKFGHPEETLHGDVVVERSNVAFMEIDE